MTEMPKHLSPSGFSTFRQCPAKYWHHYMEDHPRKPPSVEMLRGSFVHEVLERVLWMPPEHRTLGTAKYVALNLWESWIHLGANADWTDLAEGLTTEGQIAFADWTWRSIERAFAVADLSDIDVVALELKVDVILGGVPFFGFIDLVSHAGGGYYDTEDWKTGERADPSTPWYPGQRAEKVAQPLLYAAALREQGHSVNAASLVHIPAEGRAGAEVEPATDEAMDNVVEALVDVWAQITELCQQTDPQPSTSPGPLCGWCDFVALCPEGQVEVKARADRGKGVGPAAATWLLGQS